MGRGLRFKQTGNFEKLSTFLAKVLHDDIYAQLDAYARQGVAALASATPSESGETAASWSYEIVRAKGQLSITWTNTHMAGGVPLVILLQYGHGTGTGGYVRGRDFINPAISKTFDDIADGVWKAVVAA